MNWGQPARNQLRVHPGWPLNPSLNGGSAGLGGRSGVGSGGLPDDRAPGSVHAWGVPSFLLHHQHEPHECATAFAAWKGFDSPLRNRSALSSCLAGGHELWWQVQAADRSEALALLPRFVAARAEPIQVRHARIP